jgi:lipid II:glycine glycyltransferase (peptidoglycan interpeptide bridge formation enzyme)
MRAAARSRTSATGAGDLDVVVVDELQAAPDEWDRLTVDTPGGHVLQGRTWAEHRRRQGWDPHFVNFSDGRGALLLTRRQPPLPGFVAYAPRGPVAAGDAPERVAQRAIALARWCRERQGTILAVDPILAANDAYEARLLAERFRVTEEIQPSRHRLVLRLSGDDEPAAERPAPEDPKGAEERVMHGFAKSTRQRIRAAEEAGTEIVEDTRGEWLAGFGELMDATAVRKSFSFRASRGFLAWWQEVLGARQARFFVALHEGQLLGGLLAYIQGGQYATAFSADRAALRERFPGTMHLLRWTVIRAALAAGVAEIDLGGVDLPGYRRLPRQGDPSWGMYQHKASFGAEWVESAPAHEVVFRPWIYRAGVAARSIRRTVAGRRSVAERGGPA